MALHPPPNARDLLPPLLACLPASFVSPRPLPALLPLLSPLLRQRVNFLADSAGSNGWLPLLSWDPEVGSRLPPVVERMDLEPHPVSGELELDEVRPAKYKRLDEETMQARLDVVQFDILPIYVWCDKDDHGGTEPGWKLADLRTSEDHEDDAEWFDSQPEANRAANIPAAGGPESSSRSQAEAAQEAEDDDYWGSYDKPVEERAPGEPAAGAGAKTTDVDYYDRYGEEVQPAMDSHDPDEVGGDVGGSTLNGNSLLQAGPTIVTSSDDIGKQADYLRSLQPHTSWQPQDSAFQTSLNSENELSMPRPISPVESHSSIDKLEERAAKMSTRSNSSDRAQLSIQQHISTEVKSLFRLSKANGMSRGDFADIVQKELEVLSILDDE